MIIPAIRYLLIGVTDIGSNPEQIGDYLYPDIDILPSERLLAS